MNDHLEKIERLHRLREQGHLSLAEFEAEKADLLDSLENHETPPISLVRSGAVRFVWIIAGIAVLLCATYFAALYRTAERVSEVPISPTTSTADTVTSDDKPRSVGPPPDYMSLCIYSGVTPMGTRLSTMASLLQQQGRLVAWQENGTDWIMRTTWHDRLTDTDHEEGFEFHRRDGAEPAPACNRPIGEVMLDRVARDGMELPTLDTSLATLFYKDIGQSQPGGEHDSGGDDESSIRAVPIVAQYIALNDRCRGGSGDDDATMKACEKRDALMPEVERQGYCWGGASDQSEADRKWQRCDGR
ncbi:SHOCT domain-containing protein [Sphingobium sp. AS12]|uniref:SHOCT domain-containing protein n=1 Tax=Sphingobium sp. AS12 TaxID=2849495 RepID=UPI001C31A144|nr:SHOCT domain-containing protein [Sphingobium sp. AS12]MBV2148390.1 SHOCT domain-containing protein [Sphingobium sp. AS12]